MATRAAIAGLEQAAREMRNAILLVQGLEPTPPRLVTDKLDAAMQSLNDAIAEARR